ncbi:MAG TPA: putative transporter [Elusimicrobia bacterium]|nr:putative transporter [Elusimicrobiota bacterium]
MGQLAALTAHSVAQAVIVISLVAALGLALGNIRFFSLNFGIAGVLFAGILFGHFGVGINPEVMEFLREFGLILFVYTIGMQVGPGFFSSLRKEGLKLNALAAAIVLLGVAATVLISRLGGIDMAAAVGLYSGAVTNTPSLAAAQQALMELPGLGEELAKQPGIGYAMAYPFGILGVILAMILARLLFRVDVAAEAAAGADEGPSAAIQSVTVENRNLEGLPLSRIPLVDELGVRISRVMHEGVVSVAQPDTLLHLGDTLLAVAPREKMDELVMLVGRKSEVDLRTLPSKVSALRIIVTRAEVLGKTLQELDLEHRYGVVVTRAARADIQFVVSPGFSLHFGDALQAVGEEESLKKVSELLGNSPKALSHPQLIPVFVGIALGVVLGQMPLHLPGLSAPVRLGLAGGPLVVAILLSRIRRIGPISWYMPISANFMLRELGIILFLACVGLKAGDRFWETLSRGDGLFWMACASLITFLPLAIVTLVARLKFKLNYLTLCGLMAGSMTDPPALSFANSLAPSGATSIAYATVYPLVMLLRVVSAQIIVRCCIG